jgi:hypothetical protein
MAVTVTDVNNKLINPRGGKKGKRIHEAFDPEYDFIIEGMAPVDFGTNEFVAPIAGRQEINPEFAELARP